MTSPEILQKNAEYIAHLYRQINAIRLGQLDELVRIASPAQIKFSAQDAANLYMQAFPDAELISESFAAFLHLLQSQNMLLPTYASDIRPAKNACSLFYAPNSYTETAREKFSTVISEYIPCPQTDFQTICEAVVSEENSFCILPVASSTEGELPAFARMIHEYQLKTRAVCDVITSDGETELRFALLSGQILWSSDAAFAEISFQPESGDLLTASLTALQRLGANLYNINSRPMEYNLNRFSYKITVEVTPESIDSIATFVTAAMHASISGIYNIL